jgi:hypothetical protein
MASFFKLKVWFNEGFSVNVLPKSNQILRIIGSKLKIVVDSQLNGVYLVEVQSDGKSPFSISLAKLVEKAELKLL